MTTTIAATADVDPRAELGEGCRVWHLAQIREDAVLAPGCVVGRGAYVDAGVRVGRNGKIQNHALVYAPAVLGDGVFVGPAAVLTNDVNPRAVRPDGTLKTGADWDPRRS
jgi:UDP-3-O-[3-hydroxymyristoyl] glucosamine N-acyltransferase